MTNCNGERAGCISRITDESSGFRHLKVKSDGTIPFHTDKGHCLVFLLEGNIHFHTAEVARRKLTSKEIMLIPKGRSYSYEVMQDSELILFSFAVMQWVCDKRYVQQMLDESETIESLSSIPVRYPLDNFLSTMKMYLDEGLNCEHLHEIKEKELFLILRAFYSVEDTMRLFHEIAGESDFRGVIMNSFMKVKNISELAALANMGRTMFDCKFKAVFGTSPRQWMMAQVARRMEVRAMDPEVTCSDLIREFNFGSATHLNWFCKKHFGCTPRELILRGRKSHKRGRGSEATPS
ncbi:MAG: helix-turn-helix domain-containing protein [Tannerella sp.]|jgi:AraC-like DNA-binding protein|nr:helix-turn-helix domain-containing protein [Tannerella sp.]